MNNLGLSPAQYGLLCVDKALLLLKEARDLLVEAEAPRATDAVRRALKSAEGARRHAVLRPYREERQLRSKGTNRGSAVRVVTGKGSAKRKP